MRYRNPHPDARHLPETLHEGRVYPACEVPPGGSVEWPHPVAGFEAAPDEPDGPPETGEPAEPEAPARAVRRRAAATGEPEVTA